MTPTTPPMAGPSLDDIQTQLGYNQDDPFVDTLSCTVETTSYSGSSTAPQGSTTWQLPAPTRHLPQWQIAAKDALDALTSTSAAFLVDKSPLMYLGPSTSSLYPLTNFTNAKLETKVHSISG